MFCAYIEIFMFCTQNRGRKCTSYSMQLISTSFWGRFCTYNNRHLTDKVHYVPRIRGMICTYKILIVTHFLCARYTLNEITPTLCMFCYACRSRYILYPVSLIFCQSVFCAVFCNRGSDDNDGNHEYDDPHGDYRRRPATKP